MKKCFLIAGGDLRFERLAEFLGENNCLVLNNINQNIKADYLILPLPVSLDGKNLNCGDEIIPLLDLIDRVKDDGIIFGGRFPEKFRKKAEEMSLNVIDYSEREEFAVLNAEATAEGALQAAMENTDRTIMGQKILIIGMGRIAKALIHLLNGFNAKITIAARKSSDRAWAELLGCKAIDISKIKTELEKADIIFNTVPAMVLNGELLENANRKCIIIDLASKPGGTDFKAAEKLGIKALHLLGIPGKAAPTTAGITIGKTIFNILEERGDKFV